MNAPTNTRWFSLRRRLLLWLLGGVTIGWFAAMGYAYIEARHEFEEFLAERSAGGWDDAHLRHELTEHFLSTLFAPLFLGLPLLGGWVWFATRRGLTPLNEIARELANRSPLRLDAVTPQEAPQEIRPLLDALNALFGRVSGALDQERRFTADAAHELRTPLAAIVAQAQVANRARDAAERDQALAQIATSGRRAARLVEQLLILARLDPAAGVVMTQVPLADLAAEVCADHGGMALDKHITLELDAPPGIHARGNADLLRMLLRNLLDNALRYTPAGGKVGVGMTAQAGVVRLNVSDSGPGIPPDQRENVMRRFHRLAGQETAGSGLGLSIVARIVELHGAQLLLREAENNHGLRVQIDLPDPAEKS